jgi:predicted amidophosphoribosyltransferase
VTFVFILGVPGLLAYRFHRRWPVLEACPACKQDVPHDREACSHCGSEFPRPEPKGTEVFA